MIWRIELQIKNKDSVDCISNRSRHDEKIRLSTSQMFKFWQLFNPTSGSWISNLMFNKNSKTRKKSFNFIFFLSKTTECLGPVIKKNSFHVKLGGLIRKTWNHIIINDLKLGEGNWMVMMSRSHSAGNYIQNWMSQDMHLQFRLETCVIHVSESDRLNPVKRYIMAHIHTHGECISLMISAIINFFN